MSSTNILRLDTGNRFDPTLEKILNFLYLYAGRPPFFSMVVSGTNCSQKNFKKYFGFKKGELVPG
jgi:hypothetical protein